MKRKTAWELVNRRRPFGVNRGFTRQNVVIPPNRPRLRQPIRIQPVAGFTRTAGFYGRFGQAARDNGLVPENKFFDTTLAMTLDSSAIEVTTSAATGGILLIPQADTESARDGRACHINSVHIKGVLQLAPGGSAVCSGIAYLYFIQDTQANGGYPTVADVFSNTIPHSILFNLVNNKRFKIIKKWVVPFNPPAGASEFYNSVSKNIDFYTNLSLPMDYSGLTGAVTEIRSNNLFFAFGSGGSVSIDDTITFNGIARVRFRG